MAPAGDQGVSESVKVMFPRQGYTLFGRIGKTNREKNLSLNVDQSK